MDTRLRIFGISLIGILVIAVWVLPTWWPILNPESAIAEGLPGLTLAERSEFALLPEDIRAAYTLLYTGDEDEEIEPQSEWALALVQARFNTGDRFAPDGNQPFEPAPGAFELLTAEFSGVDQIQFATGQLTIFQYSDGTRWLRLHDDFQSSRAPNIHIVLTRNPDPIDEQGIGVDYIDFGVLQGNVGNQNYAVPPSADFDRFPVLALYAPEYDAILATATLR